MSQGFTQALPVPLPLAKGGTGVTNTTDLLTSLGMMQTPTLQTFTSGSGTYTTPANVKYIRVHVWGAGGGGGGAVSNSAGVGGGGGGYCQKTIVSPAATYSYSVGAGGAGGAAGNNAGSAGGNSTFSTLTANGGSGGNGSGAPGAAAINNSGVDGGSASGGDLNLVGESSTCTFTYSGNANGGPGGMGGSSPHGGQGGKMTTGTNGSNGQAPGGGGSGGGSINSGPTANGGTGAAGMIFVEEFYQPVSPVGATGSGNYVLATGATITNPVINGTITGSAFNSAGPAFGAHAASTQSITANTDTKVTLGTELFDTNNNFASSRFTPTVAGYYLITGTVRGAGTTMTLLLAQLWKNGVAYNVSQIPTVGTGNACNATVSSIIYLNGTSDYVELYGAIYCSSGAEFQFATAGITSNLSGSYIRS